MDLPTLPRQPFPGNQRGAASIAITMLIMFILVAAVIASMSLSGSSVRDAAFNEEQIAALFLAESGLEQAQVQLQSVPDPTAGSVCTGIGANNPNNTLGRGRFTLSGTASGCNGLGLKCTGCTVTSIGTIPATGTVSSSRTIVRVVKLSAPSGGAYGCGGGGVTPVVCPTAAPATDQYPDIVQTIQVKTAPAILLSNMAYSRHPQGGANNINAAGCVAVSGAISVNCITRWNDESGHSNGSNVIGSRGASVALSAVGNYTMTQNLTADSIFAAVGVRVAGTSPSIVGSYWDDAGGAGVATVAGNSAASGQTNNGAACDPSSGSCTGATNPPSPIPNPPSSGSTQASNSWCYDADTLVFGFSGISTNNNNGALTSFDFGTAPPSTEVPNGSAIYPATHTNDTQIFSTLRYVTNPSYMSAPDAVSGAVVTGSVSAITFTGYIAKNSTVLTVSTAPSGSLQAGETSVSGLDAGTIISAQLTGSPPGGIGTYSVTKQGTAYGTSSVPVAMSFNNTILTVTNATAPYLAVADTIYGTGVTAGTTIASLGTGTGGVGTYKLSAPQTFAPTTIKSNGVTVTTSSSVAPTAGTRIAVAWTGSGTGLLAAGTTVDASFPPVGASFNLSARPTTPLSGAKICGGICAFFNHSSAAAKTPFTIGITGTSQWAAGMTCLNGVDASTITGLIGISGIVTASNWYEQVK